MSDSSKREDTELAKTTPLPSKKPEPPGKPFPKIEVPSPWWERTVLWIFDAYDRLVALRGKFFSWLGSKLSRSWRLLSFLLYISVIAAVVHFGLMAMDAYERRIFEMGRLEGVRSMTPCPAGASPIVYEEEVICVQKAGSTVQNAAPQ